MGFLSRERCTDGADMGVAVRGAADGSRGPGVVVFVFAWEEAAEEPDAMAPAVLACPLSAAKRARSVGGIMVGICVQSVRGLFVRCWGSPLGDICRRCLPLGSVGLLSSRAWKVTRCAAVRVVRLLCWVLADLLVPRGGCGVRGECCPAAASGACWSSRPGRGWANCRSGLCCRSHGGATPVGPPCGLCEWPVRATCLRGPWAVGHVGAGGPWALVARGSV